MADYFCEDYLDNKHHKLSQKLSKKGYSGDELRRELRRRERGGGLGSTLKMIGALFLYWALAFGVATAATFVHGLPPSD